MSIQVEIKCNICEEVFLIEKYGSGFCSKCNQAYYYDNDNYFPVLTSVQKQVLMDLFKITKDDLDINDKKELKEFDIWMEGYIRTGDSRKARLVASGVKSYTFKAACDLFYKDKDKVGNYDSDRLTMWKCKLFDNEEDARKSFG